MSTLKLMKERLEAGLPGSIGAETDDGEEIVFVDLKTNVGIIKINLTDLVSHIESFQKKKAERQGVRPEPRDILLEPMVIKSKNKRRVITAI